MKHDTVVRVGDMTVLTDRDGASALKAREAFVNRYCAERGWNPTNLTLEQILAIRGEDGWKNPQG